MKLRKPKNRSKAIRWLREGRVKEWNELRRERPDWKPDLLNMNLKGANLEGANLENAILKNTSFTSCNLTNAILRGAVVTFANFSGAVLTNADFRDVKNLTKHQLEAAKDATGLKYDPEQFSEPSLPGEVPRVFLSYAWDDKNAVLAVDQWLRDKGARVILDERNFAAGESIREEIVRWIQEAGVVVCFISRNSKDRRYPRLEREIAETLRGTSGTRVIYFNLDDTILDLVQEGRLYVPGHKLTFEEACERLWQGIKRTVQPPKAIDLSSLRDAGKEWTKIKDD
jgi:hypothetical protein